MVQTAFRIGFVFVIVMIAGISAQTNAGAFSAPLSNPPKTAPLTEAQQLRIRMLSLEQSLLYLDICASAGIPKDRCQIAPERGMVMEVPPSSALASDPSSTSSPAGTIAISDLEEQKRRQSKAPARTPAAEQKK